ncbi:NAD-dependent epimerase/dehydratase family protein [Leucobacter luti]|uniref:NAD-dependent epimerase/dehydratase family protein n=1 Tax=Leucobacter luti TaxID=340320 RepID=UPI0018E59C11|nr:NAD-dependent epimerase/dehydratase family protein [Leucobacter luti]
MRALVLGGGGAVGRVLVDELVRLGVEVTAASRSSANARIDLAGPHGLDALAEHAARYDVVVNASGVEDPRLVVAAAPAAYVDISATARTLVGISEAARPGQRVLLGAGLAPGLSTMLVAALPTRPGDDVDLGVILGTGERHGPAAVSWTADLAGQPVFAPPEGGVVVNLRERRTLPAPDGTRSYLRADFPDHVLADGARGIRVRSYLAVGDRATTAALGLVGRSPRLAPLMARAPQLGSARWSLTAVNRRTGVAVAAAGEGQSRATGVLTALGVVALLDRGPDRAVSLASLLDLADLPALGRARR